MDFLNFSSQRISNKLKMSLANLNKYRLLISILLGVILETHMSFCSNILIDIDLPKTEHYLESNSINKLNTNDSIAQTNTSPFVDPTVVSLIWLRVNDDASIYNMREIFFGNAPNATYGMDQIDSSIIEVEAPPPPPSFDVRWVNIPGRTNVWGLGLLQYDIRGIPNNAAMKDTFVVQFKNEENTGATFTFRWPKADYLSTLCDSMFLFDPTGKIPEIDMLKVDSLVIQAAGDNNITRLRIYKYGMNFPDSDSLPIVSTGIAENIGFTTATIKGNIYPNGDSGTAWFEWGISSSLETFITTTTQRFTASSNWIVIIDSLTNLSTSTIYYYRIAAQNSRGTSRGAISNFTTSTNSPFISTLHADSITMTSATVHGSINPNGYSAIVKFEYGISTSYGNEVLANPDTVSGIDTIFVSVNLTDLIPNTQYHYRIVSTNINGTVYGDDRTFTTYGDLSVFPWSSIWIDIKDDYNPTDEKRLYFGNNPDATYNLDDLSPTIREEESPPVPPSFDTRWISIPGRVNSWGNGTAPFDFRGLPENTALKDTFVIQFTNSDSSNITWTFRWQPASELSRICDSLILSDPTGQIPNVNMFLVEGLSIPNTNDLGITKLHIYKYGVKFIGSDSLPLVITIPTNEIDTSSAILYGMIHPMGNTTWGWIEIGTDSTFSNYDTLAHFPTAISNQWIPVAFPVTNLDKATKYYYRYVAQNGYGIRKGGIKSFTTKSNVPSASTLVADSVTETRATLHGRVNPRGHPTTMIFEFGKTLTYGNEIDAAPKVVDGNEDVEVTATIDSLEPNTEYHFRLTASNSNGTSHGIDNVFYTRIDTSLTPWTIFWIDIKDDANSFDTARLFFGNHVDASYEFDSLSSTIIEVESPPIPPTFDVRWVSIPGRENTWGSGTRPYDIRGIPENIEKIDTFAIHFSNDEYSDATWTFRWHDSAYLAQRCDSMFLLDPTGQIPIVDMFKIDSLAIVGPSNFNIRNLFIYKYGLRLVDSLPHLINDVKQPILSPVEFALYQNYPNPFNPITKISFKLQVSSFTSLKVYDVFGREVTTLVSENKQPGEYEVGWNAEHYANGVYFIRMTAGKYYSTVKAVLIK